MPNHSVNITVPANTQGSIVAWTNSDFFQRLTLSWADNVVIFSGFGEGTPMSTPDGQQVYQLAFSDTEYQINAAFEFSFNGWHGPYEKGWVKDPVTSTKGIFTVIEVGSEDNVDSDFNDTELTFILTPVASSSQRQAEAMASETIASGDNTLTLHAKTGYNDPKLAQEDEHYFFVPPFSGQFSDITYSGTAWKLLQGQCYNQIRPTGGYLTVSATLNKCVHEGWEEASLFLTTTFSYWFTKPTGYVSTTWKGELSGSQYHLTKIDS